MSILRELGILLFHHGFSSCTENKNINYVKAGENNFFVIRTFRDLVADLLFEVYSEGENPCTGSPIQEDMVKQGITKNDNISDLMKNYLLVGKE